MKCTYFATAPGDHSNVFLSISECRALSVKKNGVRNLSCRDIILRITGVNVIMKIFT